MCTKHALAAEVLVLLCCGLYTCTQLMQEYISVRTILDFNIKFYILAICLLYMIRLQVLYVWKPQTYLYMTPQAIVLRYFL
jgi:hypothetical protein